MDFVQRQAGTRTVGDVDYEDNNARRQSGKGFGYCNYV